MEAATLSQRKDSSAGWFMLQSFSPVDQAEVRLYATPHPCLALSPSLFCLFLSLKGFSWIKTFPLINHGALNSSLCLCFFRTWPMTTNNKEMPQREAASWKVKTMLAEVHREAEILLETKQDFIGSSWLTRSKGWKSVSVSQSGVFNTLGTWNHIPGVIGNHRISPHPPGVTNVLEHLGGIFHVRINAHLLRSRGQNGQKNLDETHNLK